MTKTRRAGHPSKASGRRIRVSAVILSVVAFIGSLAGIAIANPATGNRVAQVAQPAIVLKAPDLQAQSSAGSLVLSARPQMPRIRPITRTRGS